MTRGGDVSHVFEFSFFHTAENGTTNHNNRQRE
jgi:hypothetical protein